MEIESQDHFVRQTAGLWGASSHRSFFWSSLTDHPLFDTYKVSGMLMRLIVEWSAALAKSAERCQDLLQGFPTTE